MEINELDVVRLTDGREATVLEVLEPGKAYLLEVSDKTGEALDIFEASPDAIEAVIWHNS
mgnify:FL=1